jgi:hypothetical protein
MRLYGLALFLMCACAPVDVDPEPCAGEFCGPGPRIQLTPQGDFGHIVCQGEAWDCRLDFGALQPGATAESWTVIENVGDARLHLAEFSVTEPAFELQHPAVELEPGESLSFRLRIRIDEAAQTLLGELHFLSDAVNAEEVGQGCPASAQSCSLVRVILSASTP